MVDIVVTAANVQHGTGATLVTGVSAEAITAGQSVYLDSSGNVALADNDNSVTEAAAVGIAVCGAPGAGQPVTYITNGPVNPGVAITAGEVYIVSSTPGGIAPVADISSTEFLTVLGVAISTSEIQMGINASAVAHG